MATFDTLSKTLGYRCTCGRRISVPFTEVVAEPKDYCGCGQKSITLGLPEEVATWRRVAGG